MFFGFFSVSSAKQNQGLSVFLSSEASPAMLGAPRQQSLPFPQRLSGFFLTYTCPGKHPSDALENQALGRGEAPRISPSCSYPMGTTQQERA